MIKEQLDKEEEVKRWKIVALTLYGICRDHGDIGIIYKAHLAGDAYPAEFDELEELRNGGDKALVAEPTDQ